MFPHTFCGSKLEVLSIASGFDRNSRQIVSATERRGRKMHVGTESIHREGLLVGGVRTVSAAGCEIQQRTASRNEKPHSKRSRTVSELPSRSSEGQLFVTRLKNSFGRSF